ncbi:MAG: ABC transporter permease [Pseudomonadota bacterium]
MSNSGMGNFSRAARQALTIARRDFVATVFAPTFLLFLLTPVFMIGFALVGGLSASTATGTGEDKVRIVVIAPADRAAMLVAVDRQLRQLFRSPADPPKLRIDAPSANLEKQARALFDTDRNEVSAVLYGTLEQPHILRTARARADGNFLAQLAEQTLRAEKAGGQAQLSQGEIKVVTRGKVSSSGKGQVAYFAALGIFFLTLMLSGQAVGAMAEERSNKVIEVLAAAVPLESVFFGKLIGAFGSAVLFIGFWGAMLAALPRFLPVGFAAAFAELGAAIGPLFPLLFIGYFTMAYMLLSAVFLGVGALASSQREIQMLSLPITVFQVGVLGFATYGATHPDSWIALASQIFPFSSPHAMAARAANSPELWPHLLALVWQLFWVAITVTIAARLFRRGVLKSGSPKPRRKKAAATKEPLTG